MVTIEQLVKGYGPDFPGLQELFGIEAEEADRLRLEEPIPALERYLSSVKFLRDVTSGKAIGFLRFRVIREYFIQLAEELSRYDGIYKNQKVVEELTADDKAKIRAIGTSLDDIIRAEALEKVTEHDTAASTDYMKIKIGLELPHIKGIEGVHFPNTSEDVMANVFGMIGNQLVYGHFLTELIAFGEGLISFVEMHESEGPLVLPGLTHQQAAEPTTLGKKVMNRLTALDFHIRELLEDQGFKRFSGKLSGAVGNFTTHYAAYPDLDWRGFARRFVESFGLHYEQMTDQSVLYAREASIFTTLGNMLTPVKKFTDDFISMASCPAQFFLKRKKAGAKGSSIMPGKSNAWAMEGGLKMLNEGQDKLFFYARELPLYPHEGDMGRSYLFRNIGDVFIPIFIGLQRIGRELKQYHPNQGKIDAFFHEYPGMAGSVIQSVFKRAGIEGDSYRIVQNISINSDGSYANAQQFHDGLLGKMKELGLPAELQGEIQRLREPCALVGMADNLAREQKEILKRNFSKYREQLKTLSFF